MNEQLIVKLEQNKQKRNLTEFIKLHDLSFLLDKYRGEFIFFPETNLIFSHCFSLRSVRLKEKTPISYSYASFYLIEEAIAYFSAKLFSLRDRGPNFYCSFSPINVVEIGKDAKYSCNTGILFTDIETILTIWQTINFASDSIYFSLFSSEFDCGMIIDSSLGHYENGGNPDWVLYEITSW